VRKRKTSSQFADWVSDFVDMTESTVTGYEKYLLGEINHRDLSRIMLKLRNYIIEYRGKEEDKNDEQ